MALSVGQLYSNDDIRTYEGNLTSNSWREVWSPASGNRIRVRMLHISCDETTPVHVEVRIGNTIKMNYYVSRALTVTFPGEGWVPPSGDLDVRHQHGSSVDLAVNILGREESDS